MIIYVISYLVQIKKNKTTKKLYVKYRRKKKLKNNPAKKKIHAHKTK